MSKPLTYLRYLKLEELLALQQPLSQGPEHDELLFIVIHQVYELWFKQVIHELDEYFRGERIEFTVPIAPTGSEFQMRVWEQLLRIPYGETRSYGEIARGLGDPGLAREVGWANARNPIAIIVPCHRVIGSDGSLTGYAGGLDRKRHLLDLESGRRSLFAAITSR